MCPKMNFLSSDLMNKESITFREKKVRTVNTSETVLLDLCCKMFRRTPGTSSGRREAEGLVSLNKR